MVQGKIFSISPPEGRDSNLCPHREEDNRELILKTQFLTGIKKWHNLEILETIGLFFIDLLGVGTGSDACKVVVMWISNLRGKWSLSISFSSSLFNGV